MSMPAPPGLLSPAAFPFPAAPFPQNDVPFPAGSPYLVARLSGSAHTTSATIHVQNPTNQGDAICVMTGIGGTTWLSASCTDTQGNVYSINANAAISSYGFNAIAVNAKPLTAADTITVTYSASVYQIGVVLGVPAASLGSASYLVPAVTNAAIGQTAASFNLTSPAALSQPALLVLMLDVTNTSSGANLGLQNSSGTGAWNVVTTSFNSGYPECMLAAWRIVPGITAGQVIAQALLGAAIGNPSSMRFTALIPETRFAPVSPRPDMPPGMQSPGAWQYAPLQAPEGPWSTKYTSSPYKFTESLPATSVSQSAVARTTGKKTPAAAHPAGVLVKGTGKALAATPHPAGKLAKAAAKTLTATAHPAAVLKKAVAVTRKAVVTVRAARTAATAKALAATPHPAGKLAKGARKTLTADIHPAGTVTRSAGKRLTAAAHPAAVLKKAVAVTRKATVTTVARLVMPNRIPLFRFGAAAWRWVTGSARNQ